MSTSFFPLETDDDNIRKREVSGARETFFFPRYSVSSETIVIFAETFTSGKTVLPPSPPQIEHRTFSGCVLIPISYVCVYPFADRKPRQLLLRLRGDQKRAFGRQPVDKQILRIQTAAGRPFHYEQTVREISVGQLRSKGRVFRYVYERYAMLQMRNVRDGWHRTKTHFSFFFRETLLGNNGNRP